jgi:pentapeptide repeat protein
MGNTILILCLIVSILALIIFILALLKSQQQNKEHLMLQQAWEVTQEIRQNRWREEHEKAIMQLEKRLASQEEQMQQNEQLHIKRDEDLRLHYKEQAKDLTQYYEEQIQLLTQRYEERIEQLTIDYELALVPHIEDVTLLEQDPQQKNRRQWRPLRLPDADLSGKDLSSCYLGQANLSNAILVNANLFMADLNGANLADADLSGADLSATNLTNADLSGAILTDTNLLVADLKNANLIGASIEGARNLTQEQLATATLDQTKKIPRAPKVQVKQE